MIPESRVTYLGARFPVSQQRRFRFRVILELSVAIASILGRWRSSCVPVNLDLVPHTLALRKSSHTHGSVMRVAVCTQFWLVCYLTLQIRAVSRDNRLVFN